MTEQEQIDVKLDLCASAIRYVLYQIRDRPEARHLMGFGTESFHRLTRAYAALIGLSKEEVQEEVLKVPLSAQARLIRKERLEQILTERGLTREMQLQLLDLLGFDIGDEAV